jgi:hypothetical protein
MKSSRKHKTPPLDKVGRLLDASLIRILVILILLYAIFLAIFTSLLGKLLASAITTPLLAICIFLVDKWDRARVKKKFDWRELLKLPNFNYWNLLWIIVSIFLAQVVCGVLIAIAEQHFRPSFGKCLPDGMEGFIASLDDTTTLIEVWISGFISYFFGGYVAGKLPNYKCPSPYRHALLGSLLYSSLSVGIMIPRIISDASITEDDPGLFILAACPFFLIAILGVRVAIGKRGIFAGKSSSQVIPKTAPFARNLFAHPVVGLRVLWHNRVWSKVIAGIIVAGIVAGVAYVLRPPSPTDPLDSAKSHHTTVVGCKNAKIFGYVMPNCEVTLAWFEWGETPNLGNVTIKQRFTDNTEDYQNLVDLKENTTYFYRAVASDSKATAWGTVKSFTTSRCER